MQIFQTLLYFRLECSHSERTSRFARSCRNLLYGIVLVVSESGLVRMNTRITLKKLSRGFGQRTVM